MSGDQSAPVEPEGFPRPSENVEAGRAPGADDTVVETNAAFATPAGQSAPDVAEITETDASAAAVDEGIEAQHARPAAGFPADPALPQPAGFDPNAGPVFGPPVGFEYGVTSISTEGLSTEGVIGALGAGPKPRNKALLGTGIGLGYAALATAAAFAVIAVASPGPVTVAGLAAASASAGPSSPGPASASAAPSPAASSAAPSTAPTTAKPKPTSTVTGHVSSGTHTGDLRFFLLPPPDGSSSVQGDPDGTAESLTDIVAHYGGGSEVKSTLRQLGFKSACDRTYQDSSLGANVDIELIQLGGSGDASAWLDGYSESGTGSKSISVPGESGAKAWSWKHTDSYELSGAYREGDTFFTVDVYGDQSISAAQLASVIKAEHARLANG